MKNCKYLIACLVLLSVCMPSFGQEFIKRTPLEKSDSIIIRDVSGDSWLVYSHFFDLASTRRQAFVLFAEADATAEMMYLPDHVAHVNDFEIYDSIVYFAGDDHDGIAIMGYFDLATFPSSTVNICTVPLMASFHRLDVGVYDQTLHVFMTGDEVLGGGHFVDAWLTGTNVWQFDISINMEEVNRFDDVAALSFGVAVSGRKEVDNNGFIFFFSLPASGPSIFPASADYLRFSAIVDDRILLDAGSGNELAYVFHNSAGYDEVGALNWTTVNQYYTLATTSTPGTYLTSDISYGHTANRAELLMPHPGTFSQEIYTAYCPPVITPVPPVYYSGHKFNDERLYSLDAIRSSSGLFVAAGHGGYSENLSIYRYHSNSWPEQACFSYSSLPYGSPDHKVPNDILSFDGYSFEIEAVGEKCQDAIIPVTTECDENNTDR